MTDSRLRSLSRAAAQGDSTARARLLLERVRAGALAAERLRLAAWLGDPDALAALGSGAVKPQPDELSAWLRHLVANGSKDVVVRALACGGSSMRARARSTLMSPELADALSVIRQWADAPVANEFLAAESKRMAARLRRRQGVHLPLLLCAWATQLAGADDARWRREARRRMARWAELAKGDPRPTIRAALLPWALGGGADPANRTSCRPSAMAQAAYVDPSRTAVEAAAGTAQGRISARSRASRSRRTP